MEAKIKGWAEFAQGNQQSHIHLIDRKLELFSKMSWGGRSEKWGCTADYRLQIDDNKIPLGCLAPVGNEIAGMAFLINNDLKNYPLDALFGEYTGREVNCQIANPWLSALIVDEPFRGSGSGHQLVEWIVSKAQQLAKDGLWTYPQRRLWLFTEREPIYYLPEMYVRWGWQHHRTIVLEGMTKYVMYKNF